MTRTDDTNTEPQSFTVTCGNCGKEQENDERAIIRECSLCGGTHLTDKAQEVAKTGAHLDPIDPVVESDAYHPELPIHPDIAPGSEPAKPLPSSLRERGPSSSRGRSGAPADADPDVDVLPGLPTFGDRLFAGMEVLVGVVVAGWPLAAIGYGYWLMMTGATYPTTSPSVGVMLILGALIISISALYATGDAAVRAYERLVEEDTNE